MMSKALKIASYQFNSIVGDLQGNTDNLIQTIHEAKKEGADVFVAPELSVCGYPPEDLLLRPQFYVDCMAQLDKFLDIDGITMLIGCPYKIGGDNFNSVFVLRDGNILARYDKMCLPNYGVFDECRYFTPGAASIVFEVKGVNIGVVICHDVWETVPCMEAKDNGAELIIALNSSPFEKNKREERHQAVSYRIEENELPIIYVNQVGAQDEIVFDGGSFAMNVDGSLVYESALNQETLDYLSYESGQLSFINSYFKSNGTSSKRYINELNPVCIYPEDKLMRIYMALVLALRDYVHKNGFKGITLGLSGGIDSALTLAIAVQAVGYKNVLAVMMPSQYTADISVIDSREMVKILDVAYEEIEIKPIYDKFTEQLSPLFKDLAADTTEENLQARSRGTLLMAISNKLGYLVVTTGNKSEMATGYATLYGDMAGGFALLKDVYKTEVYALSKLINKQLIWHKEAVTKYGSVLSTKERDAYLYQYDYIIPPRIITRPPSAELRDDQCDQDSLPDYDILDAILEQLIEHAKSSQEIIAMGYDADVVVKVARMLKFNEYKRRQAAVGPKIAKVGFSKDWRYPIASKYWF